MIVSGSVIFVCAGILISRVSLLRVTLPIWYMPGETFLTRASFCSSGSSSGRASDSKLEHAMHVSNKKNLTE